MTSPYRSLCIIPARGGSKRIPRKNVRAFRGRPIIAWSIEAARLSNAFDRIMVSTDDQSIAEIARELGAETPFLRSAETSDDHATTSAVLQEVLARFEERGETFDLACCIYPTAPFVTGADLAEGRDLLARSGFDVVMPVAAFSYPIWRSLAREPDGRIVLNFPDNLNARSQDLPDAFHDAGQWYWFSVPTFRNVGALMGEKTGSILLPAEKVQDIDTEEDWRVAELKHERLFG